MALCFQYQAQAAGLAKSSSQQELGSTVSTTLVKPDKQAAGSTFARNIIPQMAPSATNAFVRAQGNKATYNTPFGPVVVERVDDEPTYIIDTEHYHVLSKIPGMDPLNDIGTILEAAYPIRKAFFESAPPDKYLKVEMYANAEQFTKALRHDGFGSPGSGAGGFCHSSTRKAYLYWQQAGVYFTRYLMLHETTHQFQMLTGACPAVAPEGLADYFGIHKWDGKKLVMGAVVPGEAILGDRPRSALNIITGNVRKRGSPKDINDLIAVSTGREGEWALIHFLINRDPAGCRKMFLQMQNTPLKDGWRIQYGQASLAPDVFPAYTDWLVKMQTYTKDNVAFFSWDKKIAVNPAIDRNAPRIRSPRGEQR